MHLSSRWLRMRRYSATQIERIHDLETRGYERWRKIMDTKKMAGFLWEKWAYSYMRDLDLQLGPYWGAKTPADHKENENKRFMEQAWRLAGSIIKDLKRSELDALHEADWVVYRARIPFRTKASGGVGGEVGRQLDRLKKAAPAELTRPAPEPEPESEGQPEVDFA